MTEIKIDSFLMVLVFMYLGAIRHYFNVKSSRRTAVSLLTYFGFGGVRKQSVKHSAIIAATFTACGTGIGDWVNPQLIFNMLVHNHTIHIPAFMMAGAFMTAGYMADSEINNLQGKK